MSLGALAALWRIYMGSRWLGPVVAFSCALISVASCCFNHDALVPPMYGGATSLVSADPPRVLLMADSQLHHAFGRSIKQSSLLSDVGVNVAVRPPELNLLAPLASRELARFAVADTKPHAVIVLGDAANLGCSSELDAFAAMMKSVVAARADVRIPWLVVHGNHDSYLSGMSSAYVPATAPANGYSAQPCAIVKAGTTPCVESAGFAWWSGEQAFTAAYELGSAGEYAWPGVCGSPDRTSYPVNKAGWLSWYIDQLRTQGAVPAADSGRRTLPEAGDSETDGWLLIDLDAAAGSPLAHVRFRATGRWYLPKNDHTLQTVYDSYLVQSLTVNGVRIVLADTSAGYRGKLAGSTSMILPTQSSELVAHIKDAGTTPVILAGHFPLGDLHSYPRRVLLDAVRKQNEKALGQSTVEYWSAHTHGPTSTGTGNNAAELNVGSTTDWPMDVAVRDLQWSLGAHQGVTVYSYASSDEVSERWLGTRRLARRVYPLQCSSEPYVSKRGMGLKYVQACAHHAAALKIGRAIGWRPPHGEAARDDSCPGDQILPRAEDVESVSLQLRSARLGTKLEPLLCLARKASKSEGVQFGTALLGETVAADQYNRLMGTPIQLTEH